MRGFVMQHVAVKLMPVCHAMQEPWEAVGIEIGEEEEGEEGEWHEDDDGDVIDTTAVERPQ